MAITVLNPRLNTLCSSRTNPILIALFLILITVNFPKPTISDSPCVYPCYPPPTGSGTTPSISTPRPPQTQTGTYPPPGYNNPSPNTGYFPNNPTPPNFDGGFVGGPPPPDPILPYFPFYYKHPLHRGDESPENSAGRSTYVVWRKQNMTPADVAEHLMPKVIQGSPETSLNSLIEELEKAKEGEKMKDFQAEKAKKSLDKQEADEEEPE